MLELKYSLTAEELKCMGFIFVVDIVLTMIAREDENIDDVSNTDNNKVPNVKKKLKITSGALKPVKRYCYLIEFLWKDREWGYRLTVNSECRILVDKGTFHIIKSLPVEEPKHIMG